MTDIDPLGLDSEMLSGAKAYLRLEHDDDDGDNDAALGGLVLAAVAYAEQFTGRILLAREVRDVVSAGSGWLILSQFPVRAVTSITGIPAEGSTFVLNAAEWEVKTSSYGEGYVRVPQPGIAGRLEIAYQAGLAADWDGLPDALRLGLLRLIAHFYAHRDAADGGAPPDAVMALLRPWRRVRVS